MSEWFRLACARANSISGREIWHLTELNAVNNRSKGAKKLRFQEGLTGWGLIGESHAELAAGTRVFSIGLEGIKGTTENRVHGHGLME